MSRSAKPQNGRRRFLRDVVRTAGGLAAVGVALGYNSKPHAHLACGCARPSHKRERLCQCLCALGQCVQACPYDTLKLATLASGLSAGTPYCRTGYSLRNV